MTDNFVNLLHISYAWLYKTEFWGRKFHAFSFNSHRNCKIFMTIFNFIFDTICVPYIFRKSIFGWNCDHDTPLCDTPLLEDTPLCDTPDELFQLQKRLPQRRQRFVKKLVNHFLLKSSKFCVVWSIRVSSISQACGPNTLNQIMYGGTLAMVTFSFYFISFHLFVR